MKNHGFGMRHFYSRKQEKQLIHAIDKAVYVVAVMGPILTLPQLSKIWIEKNAAGLSLISWSSYLCFAFIWLTYGIVHRVKPIIFANAIWILLEIFIVTGIVLYG